MKIITFSIIMLITLAMLVFFSCNFAPGSYPYAEKYIIETNESNLISVIENFKKTTPEFNLPINGLKEGRNDTNDHWYHFYIYYKDKNEIVHFWIRQKSNNKTTLALVGINEGLSLGHWKLINKDYSRQENKLQIKKFEENILRKIIKKFD